MTEKGWVSSFLHRIVTGANTCIYYGNLKRKKSWISSGEDRPSTRPSLRQKDQGPVSADIRAVLGIMNS